MAPTRKSDRSLVRTVTLVNPDDGNDYTFGPDDDVPAWAAKLITNPAAFESDDDYVDDNGEYNGARRDAEHNARGRVRRGVDAPTGLGEKAAPESAKAASESDASK